MKLTAFAALSCALFCAGGAMAGERRVCDKEWHLIPGDGKAKSQPVAAYAWHPGSRERDPGGFGIWVVVQGLDDRLYYRLLDESGTWNDAWLVIPDGTTRRAPYVYSGKDDHRLHVIVKDSRENFENRYHTEFGPQGWKPWRDIGVGDQRWGTTIEADVSEGEQFQVRLFPDDQRIHYRCGLGLGSLPGLDPWRHMTKRFATTTAVSGSSSRTRSLLKQFAEEYSKALETRNWGLAILSTHMRNCALKAGQQHTVDLSASDGKVERHISLSHRGGSQDFEINAGTWRGIITCDLEGARLSARTFMDGGGHRTVLVDADEFKLQVLDCGGSYDAGDWGRCSKETTFRPGIAIARQATKGPENFATDYLQETDPLSPMEPPATLVDEFAGGKQIRSETKTHPADNTPQMRALNEFEYCRLPDPMAVCFTAAVDPQTIIDMWKAAGVARATPATKEKERFVGDIDKITDVIEKCCPSVKGQLILYGGREILHAFGGEPPNK